MDRWQGKVAVVTGVSSGIGLAVVKDLLKENLIVVGLARRQERLTELQNSLPADQQKRFHPRKCDVSNEQDVKTTFEWIKTNLGGVDILVNNAGTAKGGVELTSPDNTEAMRQILDTNVMGVMYCTREAFNSMKDRGVDGHILIVNSVLGHKMMNFMTTKRSTNMYGPSKYAVSAMTETYRQEFANAGTKVKITSVSPGLVDTEIINEQLRQMKAILKPEDVSNAIVYCISTPPHVQIHELTIKPVGEFM